MAAICRSSCLTSVVDSGARARARDLGDPVWLMKPVADEVLLGHLKAALADGDYHLAGRSPA